MTDSELVTIATVEAPNADVICEALSDAGITPGRIAVRPANAWIQHKLRAMVDIQVAASDVAMATAVLAHLQEEAESAAVSEARESGSHKSDDDLRLEREQPRPLKRPLSLAVGFGIALLLPVAGGIYARSAALVVLSAIGHAVGLGMWLQASSQHGWYRSDLHANLGIAIFVVARIVDVLGTLDAVARYNRELPEDADTEGAAPDDRDPDRDSTTDKED